MFKRASKLIDLLLFTIVIFMMISAVGNFSTSKPLFMSAIRSNSMYPKFQRGDVIFLKSLKLQDEKSIGDIVVFRDMEGDLSTKGFIVHRLHEGNVKDGFITKGDNNNDTDQRLGDVPPIKNEWIYSKVITIADQPIKIPKLGYLSLFVIENDYSSNIPKYIVVVVILIVVVEIITELKKGKKNKRKKRRGKQGIDLIIPSIIFISLGLLLSISILASFFTMSKNVGIFYGVSESRGILQNSTIGTLAIGDTSSGKLTHIENKGIFPLFIKIYSGDTQIKISEDNIIVSPGERITLNYDIAARLTGIYDSRVFVGIFFPLFPPKLIFTLGAKSYWPVVILTIIVPSLPLYLYPFLSPTYRKNIKKYLASIF